MQHGGDGREREGVRRPVPGLAVQRRQPGRRGRQQHTRDQLARAELGVPLRMVARQPVEAVRGQAAGPLGAVQLDPGVQRGQRHRHVRGMGGDAVRGMAEDGVIAVHPLPRPAAAARHPLVAGLGQVLEVRAAGALEQVAAGRGRVAQLPGGAREQRLGQRRTAVADGRVGGEVAVADHRPDPQAAVRQLLHFVQREPGDVDEGGGPLDAELHQIDEVGAAAEIACAGMGGVRLGGLLHTAGAYIGEGLHGITSSTASAMRG